jgi:hypothetical protein
MPSEDGDWCEVDSAFDDLAWFNGKSVQLSDERSPVENVAAYASPGLAHSIDAAGLRLGEDFLKRVLG